MAKPLAYQPLTDFGVNGLNTQDNPATLTQTYLTSADNIVLRESGRISFRKGFKQKVVPSGTAIGSLIEHNDQGTNKIFASHGTSIYTIDFTSPNAAFPSSGADVKHTVSGSSGDWQFVNFNDRLHCFHAGVSPQRYDGSLGSNVKWSAHHGTTTAINLADGSEITAPNIVSGKTYKITALGNTNFWLAGASLEPVVGDIFTSTVAGSEARDALSRPANEMIEGESYKIIALGDTNFNLNGADSSPAVDEIFTANDILGIGTGRVVEVVTGTTGTIVEIKTNPTITTITVDDTTGFASDGKILIDNEVISYTGKTSTTFTGCTRGSSDTTATYHDDNDVVKTATKPPSVTTFDPSCGMGYHGRLWCGGVTESKDVVYYSNLLDGDDWAGGDSGLIDLSKVWSTDEVVAIAPYFGKLVIFGKNNIAIYNSPETVGSLAIDEVIRGIGCVARDSVQAIGDDLVFLSETGLRSLARTTEKDKLPLTDLSLAIKDRLIRNIGQSTNVKSVYVENEGFYIMTFTDKNITYVFDFKHITELGVPRVTTWTFESDREPSSMVYTKLYSGLLVGQKDGSIAGYEGYFDTDLAWASSAASYTNAPITADVSSIWIRMGENITASLLKKMILVLEGGSGATLGLRWYKDFSVNSSSTTQIDLKPATTGYTSLWGASTSLYGTTSVTTTNAGSFVTGTYYAISSAGNTDFTAIGSANNSVGTVFKATGAGSGTGAAVSHTHTASLHSASSKYTPIFGLEEYKTPLTGSAKHLKLNMSIVSNGFNTSIQDLAIISKQGKIR